VNYKSSNPLAGLSVCWIHWLHKEGWQTIWLLDLFFSSCHCVCSLCCECDDLLCWSELCD